MRIPLESGARTVSALAVPVCRLLLAATLVLATAALPDPSTAQARAFSIDPEPPVDASEVLPLYPGTAPGSENWTWHEVIGTPPWGGGGRLVRDVVHPTLVIFKPPNPKRDTHTAVIIAPGGAFLWLSIDTEGYDVARALAAEGVTAIVLKYRLKHTPQGGSPEVFRELLNQFAASLAKNKTFNPSFSPADNPGIADGIAAVRYVRQHAAQFGLNPHHIGMIGFSAGGVVTTGTILHAGLESRPNFAALIYGAFGNPSWTGATPPMFLAVASDDPTGAAASTLRAFEVLLAKHDSAELHVFENGGHGFGLQLHGLTTDLWLKEFEAWMAANGLLN